MGIIAAFGERPHVEPDRESTKWRGHESEYTVFMREMRANIRNGPTSNLPVVRDSLGPAD